MDLEEQIVDWLKACGPEGDGELGLYMGIEPTPDEPSMSAALSYLESRGWIVRDGANWKAT